MLSFLKRAARISLNRKSGFKFDQISPVRFLKIRIPPLVKAWKEIVGHSPVSGCWRKSGGHLYDLHNMLDSSKKPFWRSRWLWRIPTGPKPGKGRRKTQETIMFGRAINGFVANTESFGFQEVEMKFLQLR